jgi:predicted enzyme related to lactoylglutathione lyase
MHQNDRRIDYVEFAGGGDLAATRRFYEDAFGWTFTDYGPDYTSFADGRLNGGFDASVHAGPLVVIYATDLEAALRKVESSGGQITRPIFSFPGGRRFHFADPAGNELAVWSDTGDAA